MVYSLKYLFRGEHLGVVQVEGVGAAVEAAAVYPDHDGDPLHPPEDRPGHLEVEAVLGERSVGNPDLTIYIGYILVTKQDIEMHSDLKSFYQNRQKVALKWPCKKIQSQSHKFCSRKFLERRVKTLSIP